MWASGGTRDLRARELEQTLEDVSMATTRYQPWAVVSQLQDEINRVFGNLNDGESSSATAEWIPAVDVREYADRFELLIDLPGVEPQGVEITLDNGVLTLSGERREELTTSHASEADTAIQQERRERRQGRFYRRFILPDTADAENVKASGRHGVLEISIKKHARAQPKRIAVT
jgi:HSP20 family protein